MSDDTILRGLKRAASAIRPSAQVRGINDRGWVKGQVYGTLIVDLERRQVVAVPADRSAASTAEWFKQHPEVEVISRDRYGIYAQGGHQGAPKARQVADRFPLLQNLRQAIEQQLGRAPRPARPPSLESAEAGEVKAVAYSGARRTSTAS